MSALPTPVPMSCADERDVLYYILMWMTPIALMGALCIFFKVMDVVFFFAQVIWRYFKKSAARLLLIIAIGFFASGAQAQTWLPIAKQCAEIVTSDLHRQTGCANCSDSWPLWAECTVKTIYRNAIPKEHIDVCVSQVEKERVRTGACSACGDPVASTLACLGIH